jgi:hypothetical protein
MQSTNMSYNTFCALQILTINLRWVNHGHLVEVEDDDYDIYTPLRTVPLLRHFSCFYFKKKLESCMKIFSWIISSLYLLEPLSLYYGVFDLSRPTQTVHIEVVHSFAMVRSSYAIWFCTDPQCISMNEHFRVLEPLVSLEILLIDVITITTTSKLS